MVGVVSPLATLLASLRTDGGLSWLLVHAPDGDAGAAVKRAWEGEPSVKVLVDVARKNKGLYVLAPWGHARCAACKSRVVFAEACNACRDLLRAMGPYPTWAELTAKGEGT